MRLAFIETLCELAAHDDTIWLLTGDLGYSVLERFADRFPDRYVNVGVAEQNMTGVAAGLALEGKTVFTYSIANFPTLRCLEQIRNDVCYHNLNVKIVAVGGGLAYGAAGYTHHAIEDLAVMCAMPNMTVVAPGDIRETQAATRAIQLHPGPCYLRLGKGGEGLVHADLPHFEIGEAIELQTGRDLTLISTGAMLETVCRAARELAERGYAVSVLSMPTLQPLDREAVWAAAKRTGRIITVEEHGWGGLGTLVGEALAVANLHARYIPLRITHAEKVAGNQQTLRAGQGLGLQDIVKAGLALVEDGS